MQEYIRKLLNDVPYNMDGVVKTPATSHLFNVNNGAKKLAEEKAQLFQHIVAKLLYRCRRR